MNHTRALEWEFALGQLLHLQRRKSTCLDIIYIDLAALFPRLRDEAVSATTPSDEVMHCGFEGAPLCTFLTSSGACGRHSFLVGLLLFESGFHRLA